MIARHMEPAVNGYALRVRRGRITPTYLPSTSYSNVDVSSFDPFVKNPAEMAEALRPGLRCGQAEIVAGPASFF
jgi:hypothetical protein